MEQLASTELISVRMMIKIVGLKSYGGSFAALIEWFFGEIWWPSPCDKSSSQAFAMSLRQVYVATSLRDDSLQQVIAISFCNKSL